MPVEVVCQMRNLVVCFQSENRNNFCKRPCKARMCHIENARWPVRVNNLRILGKCSSLKDASKWVEWRNVTNMRQAGLPLIRPWLVNYHFGIEQQSPQDGFPLDGVLGDNSHETQAVATTLDFKTIFKFEEKRVGLLICHKCKTQQVNWLSSNTGLRVFWTYK